MDTRQSTAEFSPNMPATREEAANKYVIERTGETFREWWTGTRWTDDESAALQFSGEPDPSVETLDEGAKAVKVQDVDD